LCLARPLRQTTFASPEDASRALFAAVQRHDERAVTEILGAGTDLVSSDDKVQDTLNRERLVQKYEDMHRMVKETRGDKAHYFRTLSKSAGGFAAIAYPSLYRSSGVMTFIVNHDDVVYEKDLGPNTAKAASAMTTAHLDATWTPAESMP